MRKWGINEKNDPGVRSHDTLGALILGKKVKIVRWSRVVSNLELATISQFKAVHVLLIAECKLNGSMASAETTGLNWTTDSQGAAGQLR